MKTRQYKGIKRQKFDDQPHKAVRTGTGSFTRRVLPDKSKRVARGLPGSRMGKCLLAVGKEATDCNCGGHSVK